MKNKFEKAFELQKSGNLQEAKKIYEKILEENPNDFKCLHHLGLIAKRNEEYLSAFDLISRAIAINPYSSAAHYNLGNILQDLNKINDAILSYDKAINIKPDYELYFIKGKACYKLKKLNEALASYDEAIKLKVDDSLSYCNRGLVLVELHRIEDGIADYNKAIEINSHFILARYNRGLALKLLRMGRESEEAFKSIIEIEPYNVESLYELALFYKGAKQYNLALTYCDQILEIDPKHTQTIFLGIKIRKFSCNWVSYEKDYLYASKEVNNAESIGPFSSYLFNNLDLQKKIAKGYATKYSSFANPKKILPYKNHKKIRIGYFSPDYNNHPVSNLLVELIEKHDKSKFEIYGFSLVDWPTEDINIRLKKAFTKFINLENKQSKDIVKLAKDLEIDIAIDLALYTGSTRCDIFAMRTAPIQINYLGAPGTSGTDYYDYIIADHVLIPKDYEKYYSESILYLDQYFPSDSMRPTANNKFNRIDFNLPTECVIFCSTNNHYKYNPSIFSSWMKILGKVDNSFIFLSADSEIVKDNLKREANAKNINPDRLLFADKKIPYSMYIERLNLMDLFLDTFPFNGMSSSCDTLWAGLPLITLKGSTIASRGGASLLNSVGLNSLITSSIEEYEHLAIDLGNNPHKLKKIRQILQDKSKLDLFNMVKFTTNIEDLYQKVYART